MDGWVHGQGRGRKPSNFDWIMLTASLATLMWILVAH